LVSFKIDLIPSGIGAADDRRGGTKKKQPGGFQRHSEEEPARREKHSCACRDRSKPQDYEAAWGRRLIILRAEHGREREWDDVVGEKSRKKERR